MNFKVVAVLCLVISCAYAYNYTWGMRQHNDRLLTREYARKSSSMFRVVTLDVYFPNKTVS